MKLASKVRKLKAAEARYVRLRTEALAALPEQYGFRNADAFVRAVRKARQARVANFKRRLSIRFGGSRILRLKIAELFEQGKTPVGIAVELGLSLRTVDRVMATLANRAKRTREARSPRHKKRRPK